MVESVPSSSSRAGSSPKRKSSSGDSSDKPHRPTKRRASKACQCCRARKVRCNVVEHGPPCTNCRLDEVECVVTESKRKRRSLPKVEEEPPQEIPMTVHIRDARNRVSHGILDGIPNLQNLASRPDLRGSSTREHIPHSLYRTHSDRPVKGDGNERPVLSSSNTVSDTSSKWGGLLDNNSVAPGPAPVPQGRSLPGFLKPVPTRMGAEEVEYLVKKGALEIPDVWLRHELCRAYVEFVHPYMPLINVHEFLQTMSKGDGSHGKISLLLFQGMMFAGSAFVDMGLLLKAGFTSRKDARKVFFQRVRHLYDFDYDIDRFSQVQTLLLMTSWYETSDDKKDAWHWMGIAIATSYTIGLHRNPALSNMDPAQQRQWKRVWWACVIRDRLIALGARRPIRIKPEDCDVPMLSLADFDFGVLSDDIDSVPPDCRVVRDVQTQTNLAVMCIQKAKLCLCISDVLTSQYSIQKSQSALSGIDMRTAAVLSPKPVESDASTVTACHDNLQQWLRQLPKDLHPSNELIPKEPVGRGDAPVVLQRALLYLIYLATLSALHRPQVLHNIPTATQASDDSVSKLSRESLRHAALETTKTAKDLLDIDLVQYLPTTGVSVLQPAIISHLLDIKSADEDVRRTALQGFCQCIQVLEKLRECYTAADHSIALVEAAIRRADIKIPVQVSTPSDTSTSSSDNSTEKTAASTEDLVDAGRRENLVSTPRAKMQTATPPPDLTRSNEAPKAATARLGPGNISMPTDVDIARKLEVFLASTPLEAEPQSVPGVDYLTCVPVGHYTYDADFDSFVNFSGSDVNFQDAGMDAGDDQGFDPSQHLAGMPSLSQYTSPHPSMMFFNDADDMNSPVAEFDSSVKMEGPKEFGTSPVSVAVPS